MLVFLVIALFLVLYIFSFRATKSRLMLDGLPGPKGLPIIGIGFELMLKSLEGFLDFLQELCFEYGRIVSFTIIGHPIVILWEPEDIEKVLRSSDNLKKGKEYRFARALLRDGLLVSSGKKWQKRRKLLTPAFHFSILESNFPSMNEHARLLAKRMLDERGNVVNVNRMVSLCTLDIMCETSMGVSLNTLQGRNSQYYKAISSFGDIVLKRIRNPIYQIDWIFKKLPIGREMNRHVDYLHEFTDRVIAEKKAERKTFATEKTNDDFGMKRKQAFLDCLLELQANDSDFTDSDISEEVDTFMAEGQHTLASALSFCVEMIGLHLEIQENAHLEQFDIFGNDQERHATLQDLSEMKYLERIIKETLRLYPSAPYFSRWTTRDINLDNDVDIPAGVNLLIPPFVVHRNPKWFSSPEQFDPDRFDENRSVGRHPYAFIPFSAGPRNCIGQKYAMMELKIVLSTLLRQTKITSVTDRRNIRYIPSIVLNADRPFLARVSPRMEVTKLNYVQMN